jgi:hypothetical protein
MSTEKMLRVIEKLGEAVYTEQDVIDQFAGKNEKEILDILNETYWSDDNSKFANDIYNALK